MQNAVGDSMGTPRVQWSIPPQAGSDDQSATYGSWSDENDSLKYFVDLVRRTNAFAVFTERVGKPLWKHHFR